MIQLIYKICNFGEYRLKRGPVPLRAKLLDTKKLLDTGSNWYIVNLLSLIGSSHCKWSEKSLESTRRTMLGRWIRKLWKPVSTFAWYLWSYSSQFENYGSSKYRLLRKIFIWWRLLLFFTIRRHHGWTEGRRWRQNFITYEDGKFTGPIGKELLCVFWWL